MFPAPKGLAVATLISINLPMKVFGQFTLNNTTVCYVPGGKRAYSSRRRSRSAFVTTETELSDIANAAIIGLRRMPNAG